MKEAEALNSVSKFHKTFNHPILSEPQIPSKNRAELRLNLLREELQELEEAVKNQDLVEAADALCDLQYVLAGAILEFGMGERFASLFEEVQRSNMSKVCRSEEEAQATVNHYISQNQDAYYERKEDFFLVYRKSDNKTLKSINYSEVDLKSILNQ
ncbi:nucleoside triphosphate pyrophosphohydrolase family protein [Marivirga harenae]|uniref:nucleoside triphosphate pyrophosphohydrolase family protein n=1 Tax=Marivirga harenae TaxID=2010992 RepID=UPI0026E07817|nr:nucleoside triphosphate pyrophosphohydrolase family protein [Marivirga harenae]WKV11528.1 nucleoside triphosphate pyrophosphohydrolase family protein [Marivirga harenae]|tara:strand:- start:12285 stop:12752 length:468 start_codon:yes stop_codon:yes gene_type:complete